MNPATGKILALVMAFVAIISTLYIGQVNCSSYLDDYFLPTAKIALNKLQQSLSPSSYTPPALPPNVSQQQEEQISSTTSQSTINNIDQQQQQEVRPIKTSGQEPAWVNSTATGTATTPRPLDNLVAKFENLDGKLAASTQAPPPSPPTAVQQINGGPPKVDPAPGIFTEKSEISTQDSHKMAAELATTTIETSTDSATDSDPTLTTTTSVSDPTSANTEQVAIGAAETSSGEPKLLDTVGEFGLATTTTTTTTVQPETAQTNANQAEQQAQPSQVMTIESKSADEAAIRETELEAVAAVDASIGFGDLFGSMGDSCYDEYANARYCEPEFENLAYERQVEVSSECGNPPSRFCTAYLNERHEQIRNCHICDAQHPKKRHPATYLTDMNNSNSPTCWVSAPINAAPSPSSSTSIMSNSTIATTGSGGLGDTMQAAGGPAKPDNVTLTLNLDKKYEITYISMQFCSTKPDSLAIYKSMDYGRSWHPYQFYSTQCRRMYGRQSRAATAPLARVDEFEATCVNTSNSSNQSPASGRIAFSTLDGRSGGHNNNNNNNNNLDRAKQLQDWITATNIKIVLDRHQASWIHSNLIHPHAHNHHHNHKPASDAGTGSGKGSSGNQPLSAAPADTMAPTTTTTTTTTTSLAAAQNNNNNEPIESSLTSPSDTFNYAMSDLTVGGRCKCNGHASRCIHSKEGRLQCDCRHNTAGRDCEKCAPFHFDRPWARATQMDANPCQPCNCNGHSRKCRFDAELYRLSGKRSGGVCIGCKDNTAGRHCNYCKEEFTRDHSKPMSDKEACKHCDCHPIGSLGRACNQTTGQCACKEGVSGLQCNRCAPGYQQSSSLTDPCIKLPENENDINYYPPLTVDGDVDRSATSEHNLQSQEDGTTTSDQSSGPEEPVPPVVGTPRFKPQQQQGLNKLGPQTSEDPQPDLNGDDGSMNSQFEPAHHQQMLPQDRDDEAASGNGSGEAMEGDQQQQPGFDLRNKPASHRNSHWRDQAHQGTSSSSRNNNNKANTYYRYHYQRPTHNRHPQYDPQTLPVGAGNPDEDDTNNNDDQDQEEDEQMPRRTSRPMPADDEGYQAAAAPPHQQVNSRRYNNYYATNTFSKPRYFANEYRGQRRLAHQQNGGPRHRGEPDLMVQPMVNVEHGDEGLNSLDDANNYGALPPSSNSIYAEENFNQIQTPNLRRLATTTATSRGRQVSIRQRGGSQFNLEQPQQPISLASNEIVCGDCQSGTRRLNLRQFCHLHFAIKATILNKYMADDWTRFEVEIQDIFRSQGGQNSMLATTMVAAAAAAAADEQRGINNMLLSDEPSSIVARAGNGSLAAVGALLDASTIDQNVPLTHKIKVGTIQSIWVPTEDLTCRCPRLKLRSTYLLMGSIDAKENSANALQLDRHGVAVEWESSLQKRLLRYQRRLSRGKC